MAGRRTNLALLVLLVVAVATGVGAYAIGTGWARPVLVVHAVAAFAIVLLTPWKSVIARRGLKRARAGTAGSIALSALVVLAVVFGILHSSGIAVDLGALSAMQVHVGAALLALPFAVWHVVARRVRVYRNDLSRRQLLKAGILLGGAGAVYAGTEAIARVASLPGSRRRFTGSHERGSRAPDEMPVTQWFDDGVPAIDADTWRLIVQDRGGVARLGYPEIAEFDDRVTATIDCTGGWFAVQRWEGVWLSRIVNLDESARSFVVVSSTGYRRRLPASLLDRTLLATRIDGAPLSAGHGFPARLVVPGRRGFWWVKWVTEIEESALPSWAQSPFPLT